jgi:MFS superfamily sulfate permease-like transporter
MFLLWSGQLLTIMSRSIAYLTSRVNFSQVSQEIPVTKQRNLDKVDPADVFEGTTVFSLSLPLSLGISRNFGFSYPLPL